MTQCFGRFAVRYTTLSAVAFTSPDLETIGPDFATSNGAANAARDFTTILMTSTYVIAAQRGTPRA